MGWLDDEANENKRREEAERHREEVLRVSNYWGAIVQRLGEEVNAINSHDYWKTKLAGFPLRLQEPLGESGYEIAKSGHPSVSVKIQHKGNHILVSRQFRENPLASKYKGTEKLRLATSGDSVVLLNEEDDALIVPDHAVQYMLMPIIESLKITKTAP